jgi:VWFA-related protein
LAVVGSPTGQEPPVERHLWERQIPLRTVGEIEVENPRGRILVNEGRPGQVQLVAEGSTAPVISDDLKINLQKSKLAVKYVSGDRRVMDLHLTVPPGVRLKLKAEEGTVQVHARVSDIFVETLSGDVVLGIPVEDLKIEITWMEGYIRYGGPELQRINSPALATLPAQRWGPQPARLAGQTGSGRVHIDIRTLNGWVEINPGTTANRIVLGALPPQPMSRAARAIAGHGQSPLGSAIRFIEPRLEKAIEPLESVSATRASSSDDENVVKLESPLVNLNASVTDADGKVISGLTIQDFMVTEDGARQPITHFATEAAPFNLVLLLDASGSTRGKIDLIRAAAMRFLDLMHPSDKVAILLFARDVEVLAHLTSDRESLRQALRHVVPPLGSTALYDALAYAMVEELGGVRGERNAIVVVTDGRDSSMAYADTPLANDPLRRPGSFLRFSDLVAGVGQSDVLIYSIAVENEAELAATLIESARQQVQADTRRAQEQLKQLAEISGGRLYHVALLNGLDGVYEQIAADLRTFYSLAYAPMRIERDGSWRRVEVKVSRPGTRVRSPQGYFAR